ncbi:IS110 family transposase [Parahaliea mediterranea]|uniref:IS110 family transposase n=1 Tax=Parahaliea mediterranea TaxID=651086 RepID=UPI000E2F6840|nr:IS110 family transposase [Parahaliea mediterranea]
MQIIRVGVDLAKNVFQVHGVDSRERPVWRKNLKRSTWLAEIQHRVPSGAEIGLEACSGAHHWGRQLIARGYQVKLIAPQFVKPYVKSNKSDRNDAAAICEAMSRPSMRFVALKSIEQQDIQAIHRVRSEVVKQRTAKANQIRGLVGEYGLIAPQGIHALRAALPCWLEDAENGLSDRFRRLLARLADDLRYLDARVEEYDAEIAIMAKELPAARRLMALQGVGPVIATALVATLGSGDGFTKGRDFAVTLGLTPKHHGTGGKERILGISKRGDAYLRTVLIHGARSAVYAAKGKTDPLSRWINELLERRHPNVVIVALANKTARIAWALVRNGSEYAPEWSGQALPAQ